MPRIRHTKAISHYPSTTLFELPTKKNKEVYKMKGVTPYLTGFECNSVDGRGVKFNFILSNRDRSYQRDKGEKYSTHLMPEGAFERIKSR